MPILTIHTNVAKSAVPETFIEEATEKFAQGICRAKEVSRYNTSDAFSTIQ